MPKQKTGGGRGRKAAAPAQEIDNLQEETAAHKDEEEDISEGEEGTQQLNTQEQHCYRLNSRLYKTQD